MLKLTKGKVSCYMAAGQMVEPNFTTTQTCWIQNSGDVLKSHRETKNISVKAKKYLPLSKYLVLAADVICPWSSSAGDTRTQSWARRRRLPRPAMASWRLPEDGGGQEAGSCSGGRGGHCHWHGGGGHDGGWHLEHEYLITAWQPSWEHVVILDGASMFIF